MYSEAIVCVCMFACMCVTVSACKQAWCRTDKYIHAQSFSRSLSVHTSFTKAITWIVASFSKRALPKQCPLSKRTSQFQAFSSTYTFIQLIPTVLFPLRTDISPMYVCVRACVFTLLYGRAGAPLCLYLALFV